MGLSDQRIYARDSPQKPAIKQLSLADIREAENSIEKLAKQTTSPGSPDTWRGRKVDDVDDAPLPSGEAP